MFDLNRKSGFIFPVLIVLLIAAALGVIFVFPAALSGYFAVQDVSNIFSNPLGVVTPTERGVVTPTERGEDVFYATTVSGNSFVSGSSNAVLPAWLSGLSRYAVLSRAVNPSLFCPGYEQRFAGDFSVYSDAGSVCLFTGLNSYEDSATERFTSWLLTEGDYRQPDGTASGGVKPDNIVQIEVDAATSFGGGTGRAAYVVFAKIARTGATNTEWRWIGKCEIRSRAGVMESCSLNIGRSGSTWVVDSIIVGRQDVATRPSVRVRAVKVKTRS
ncbi:hypothetical protein HY571_00865 [Candidatus Micrarchaeota archaeon]|nr:hypothetical protein [Candidatus Micrarchaeota archaeon]